MKKGRARRIIYGALGGAIGASCMTVVRLAARRRGLIDKTVSQAAEEWVASRVIAFSREPAVHHLFDQALHVGYGASLGAIYGLVAGPKRGGVGSGAGFGVLTWLFGSWLMMPMLGVKRPPWRKSAVENGIDLLAHLIYGVSVDVVSGEMNAQTDHRTSSDMRRWLSRVG